MTVSSQTNNATFVGNGVTTSFPLPFRFFRNSDVFAYFVDSVTGISTPMTQGVDYTLAGAGKPEVDGAALSVLTTTVPLANLRGMYVERVMPQVQETDIVNQGEFFASTHEDVFDRLTMLIQQADSNGRGAIRVAIGDPEPARLPPAPTRAGLLMGFDSNGDPIVVSPTSGSLEDFSLLLADQNNPVYGAGMVGYRGRTVHGRLDDTFNVKDDWGAGGAVGDGVTDDYPAFAAAIAAAATAGGGTIVVPRGSYLLSQQITLTSGMSLAGDGQGKTTLIGGGLSGPVVKVTGWFCRVVSMTVSATPARTASGSTSGHGILQEPADSAGQECNFCVYDDLIISNQPRHGLALVSGYMNARVTSSRIQFNGGHGILIDNGTATSRVNKSRPGGILISHCRITDNVGHSIQGGQFEQGQNWCYRIEVDNCDTFRNALVAGVRINNYGMRFVGEDILVKQSALCGYAGIGGITPTTGGIWVAGKDIQLNQNRYIQIVDHAVFIGYGAELSTQGVKVDGLLVAGDGSALSLDPAVGSASDARGIEVQTDTNTLITRLVFEGLVDFYTRNKNIETTDRLRNNKTRDMANTGFTSSSINYTLADDGAAYIEFSAPAQGMIAISGGTSALGGALVYFRVGATAPHSTAMASGGATLSTGVGTLANGASGGVDGNLNVYASSSNNRLYIKNRTASSGSYGYTLLNITAGVTASEIVTL